VILEALAWKAVTGGNPVVIVTGMVVLIGPVRVIFPVPREMFAVPLIIVPLLWFPEPCGSAPAERNNKAIKMMQAAIVPLRIGIGNGFMGKIVLS